MPTPAGAIPAYTRLRRDHLWDARNRRLSVVYLPPSAVTKEMRFDAFRDLPPIDRNERSFGEGDDLEAFVQSRMADRVKLSKSTLARYIGLTDIPQTIVSAFASPMDLQVRHGDKLLPLLRNPGMRSKMEETAMEANAAEKLKAIYPPGGHDFPDEARKEAYAFLDKWLKP